MSPTVKILIIIVIILGAGVGIWLAAPLFYDRQVNEALPSPLASLSPAAPAPQTNGTAPAPAAPAAPAASPSAERSGTFEGADAFHQASGTARIVTVGDTQYVRFEDDFSVTNGPDLFVYFGNDGRYDAETNLGRLKGNQGSQNYEIPSDIDPGQYNEVWVWCRAFAVPFGSAQL